MRGGHENRFIAYPKQQCFPIICKVIRNVCVLIAYVYFRIPSNLDVQMITLLSAPPDANLFPGKKEYIFVTFAQKN